MEYLYLKSSLMLCRVILMFRYFWHFSWTSLYLGQASLTQQNITQKILLSRIETKNGLLEILLAN